MATRYYFEIGPQNVVVTFSGTPTVADARELLQPKGYITEATPFYRPHGKYSYEVDRKSEAVMPLAELKRADGTIGV